MAAAIFSVTLMGIAWILKRVDQPAEHSILPSVVAEFGISSTKHLIVGYAILFALFSSYLLCLVLSQPRAPVAGNKPHRSSAWLILVSIWLLLIPLGNYTLWSNWSFAISIIALPFFRGLRLGERTYASGMIRLTVCVAALYVFLAFLLPFLTPVLILNAESLVASSSHYAMLLLPGFDMVCCAETGLAEHSEYGLSIMLLTAIGYQAMQGVAGTPEETILFVLKFYQLAAAGLLVYTARLLNRKYYYLIAALALLASTSLAASGNSIYFPNQSGIRFLPLLVGIAALAFQAANAQSQPVALGLVSGAIFALSPECGIVILAGYVVYLGLTKFDPSEPFSSTLGSFGLYFGSAAAASGVIVFFAERLFFRQASTDPSSLLALFTSGSMGLVNDMSILAPLLTFFGCSALVRGAILARMGNISPVSAYQAAIGAMILVWLAYYLNRMHDWNLWLQAVLLICLFAPKIRPSILRFYRRKLDLSKFYVATATALVIGLLFQSAHRFAIGDMRHFAGLAQEGCLEKLALFQKYCHLSPQTAEIVAQLSALDGLSRFDNLVVSLLPAQVRFMGFNEGFPWYEPFSETRTLRDMEKMTRWINAHGPRYIVMDNPISSVAAAMPNRREHMRMIELRLTAYRRIRTVPGWIFYQRSDI